MKSKFKKLRDFALNKHGPKEKLSMDSFDPEVEPGEVTKGMQDVADMQKQYDGLCNVGHFIAGSAYDFSRSLQEMASYMVEIFGQIGDGEIGNIFNMLGKVQYEISKLVDTYVAHVSQTIIKPTENLLSELKNVEDMKGRYDEKRVQYNHLSTQKPKGKLKTGKGDALDQQLMLAKEEFENEAMILSSRLQSLKQGRPLSLLTQAARYHTAQTHFFSKGLASLNALEPVMKQLTLVHNIDRTMSEGDVGAHVHVEGMEMDVDVFENGDESESFASSPRVFQTDDFQRDLEKPLRKWETSSKSAPISPSMYHQSNVVGKVPELFLDRPPRTTITTYALPSPLSKTTALTTESYTPSQGMQSLTVSKSEPHPQHRYEASVQDNDNLVSNISYDLKGLHVVRDSSAEMQKEHLALAMRGETKQVTKQNQDPGRQTEVTSDKRLNAYSESVQDGELTVSQISSRYGHSGPLPAKLWASHKKISANSSGVQPVPSYEVDHLYKSGPVSKSPISRAFVSPRISPSISPPHLSPPHISELHKLPPPPLGSSALPPKLTSIIAHSAPLGNKFPEAPLKPDSTSPLPHPPPGHVTRSLSIPSSASRTRKFEQANITFSEGEETSQRGLLSPTLNPILLPSFSSGIHVSIDDELQNTKPMSKVQSSQ